MSPFSFRIIFAVQVIAALFVTGAQAMQADNAVGQVQKWLDQPAAKRGELAKQPFAETKLTSEQAQQISKKLWDDYAQRTKKERQKEWENKVIELDDLKMKFEFKIFGKKPKNGRSLFISMHGGGGTRASVNDQQWKNQITLYRPEEGVYLAPRAPTDKWNLWHEPHIDKFFARIIQDAILLEDVDPNRIYLMGYSAGGDGVYQLAPRMADSWAAAAMMAGHPNGAAPNGLRNIGFTLHVGAKDKAFKRNQIGERWKKKLADLKKADPAGYDHTVFVHEGLGHWMEGKDQIAVPWMAKFTRDPHPKKIVWRQSGVTHEHFYWLRQRDETAKGGNEVTATRDGQAINVEFTNGLQQLSFCFNDDIVDLDQPIAITFGDNPANKQTLSRQTKWIHESIQKFGDPSRIYSAEVTLDVPQPTGK